MDRSIAKNKKRQRRRERIRSKIKGTAECPRLSVWRSHLHLYAQLIDDDKGATLISVHSREVKSEEKKGKAAKKPVEISFVLGEKLAAKAKDKKIKRVVFDRGGYKYHGRVKAVAEGARTGGLEF